MRSATNRWNKSTQLHTYAVKFLNDSITKIKHTSAKEAMLTAKRARLALGSRGERATTPVSAENLGHSGGSKKNCPICKGTVE